MARKHDDKRMRRLYEEGAHISQIARMMGCHRMTVYRALEKQGVELRDDRENPQRVPKTMCGKGLHPLEGDNVRVDNRGKRNCVKCETLRWYIYDATHQKGQE